MQVAVDYGQTLHVRITPRGQAEKFVVEKAKSLLGEPSLISAVLDASRAQGEAGLRELAHQRELIEPRLNAARAVPPEKRSAEMNQILDDLAQQATAIDLEIASLRTALPQRTQIEARLQDFESLWAALTPTERVRVLECLLCMVLYDAKAGSITLVPHRPPSLHRSTSAKNKGKP